MKMRIPIFPLLLLLLSATLQAQTTLYWDGDGSGTVGGGSGTWDTTLARWSTTVGGSTYQVWNNVAPTDHAVFQNTAGVVTMGAKIEVRSLTFGTTGYSLIGSGTLLDNLTFSGGIGSIDTGSGHQIIDVTIRGNDGLTKIGAGTLNLRSANEYTGATTVKSGTLSLTQGGSVSHISNPTIVGDTNGDIGALELSDGSLSNTNATIGNAAGSRGSVAVHGGTWTNSGALVVGQSGTGSLTVGGYTFGASLVSVDGITRTGASAGSSGAITLSGYELSDGLYQGTLSTNQIAEGDGAGTVTFDGGILQARVNESDFISGYESGDVTIDYGRAYIDSNGFDIGISSPLSGPGGLVKRGLGTLTLNGAHTYGYDSYQGTIVESGTLVLGVGASITHAHPETSTVIGNNSGDVASLQISGGTFSNGHVEIGLVAGSTGSATITSGTWTNSSELDVGVWGTGSLLVDGGLVTNSQGSIGVRESGTATVTSGTWANSGELYVGKYGTGSLLVNGGLVTNTEGTISLSGNGTATVSSGTWANSSSLHVGYYGTGELLVNGGLVSNSNGYIARGEDSIGSATVSSGTWTNGYLLTVGDYGSGSLLITGGTTIADIVYVSARSASSGSIMLSGTSGNRGLLSTNQLFKGSGTGTVTFDGGILQARDDESDFITNFEAGDVTINSGGAFIDSNGFDIGIAAPLSGSGGLTKQGAGTLTLSGTNTYTGSTVVNSGTLTLESGGSISHPAAQTVIGSAADDDGALKISGGTLSNTNATIGNGAGSQGAATITSGTWTNSDVLWVGNSGTGSLLVDGGTVSSASAVLGYNGTGVGSVTVSSGTWSNGNTLLIGRVGAGSLTVSGGLVSVDGLTRTSNFGGSTGSITLSGTSGNRGTLFTNQVIEGSSGSGTVTFDGGILKVRVDESDFISGYESGDVTINADGAFLDSNGFSIGISTQLSGTGGLTKQGAGTLTLSGSNTYSGGTVVNSGTLSAAHNNAVGTGGVIVDGGVFLILEGFAPTNAITLAGGTVAHEFGTGASLTNAINATSSLAGGTDTTASILGGTTSGTATLTGSFAATSGADNDTIRMSDAFSLTGVPVVNVGTGETDLFVLQLQVVDVTAESFLGWLDPGSNEWVNATDGNFGGTASFRGDASYNPATDFVLGYYGVDTANDTLWAVLNHNSEFGVVPEPTTCALIALGLGSLLLRRRST